jgi:hypothetical protein
VGLNVNLVKHYEWPYLASAVIVIVRENKRAVGNGVTDADSDEWTRCTELRRLLTTRVRQRWAILAEKELHQFPWSEDAVCEWYMKCRKRSDAELDVYEQDLKRMRGEINLFAGAR